MHTQTYKMFVAFVALTSFTCARAQDASISEAQKRKASVEAKLEQARALGVTPAAQDAQLRSTPAGIAALATISNEEISNGNRSWVLELSGVGQRLQLIFGSQSARQGYSLALASSGDNYVPVTLPISGTESFQIGSTPHYDNAETAYVEALSQIAAVEAGEDSAVQAGSSDVQIGWLTPSTLPENADGAIVYITAPGQVVVIYYHQGEITAILANRTGLEAATTQVGGTSGGGTETLMAPPNYVENVCLKLYQLCITGQTNHQATVNACVAFLQHCVPNRRPAERQ